jgi:hypothetical protein
LLLGLDAAAYLTAVIWLLSPPLAVVFVVAHQGLFGLYLGCAFAPNHNGMPILTKDDESDFLRRQVLTARNVRGNWLVDFLLGGLNYQIEHHLFPSMPRAHVAPGPADRPPLLSAPGPALHRDWAWSTPTGRPCTTCTPSAAAANRFEHPNRPPGAYRGQATGGARVSGNRLVRVWDRAGLVPVASTVERDFADCDRIPERFSTEGIAIPTLEWAAPPRARLPSLLSDLPSLHSDRGVSSSECLAEIPL